VEHKPSHQIGHFGVLDGKASLLDICWREIQNFTDPHASSRHQFHQHEPIPHVCCPEDDLIDSLLVDDIPLDSLWAFEDLSYDGRVTGISKSGKTGIYAEVIKGCQDRVPIPLGRLLVVLRQGKQKLQHLLLGNAGKITLPKSCRKSMEDKLTCFDGIFFWSSPGDIEDGSRLLEKLSWCASFGWNCMSNMLTLE